MPRHRKRAKRQVHDGDASDGGQPGPDMFSHLPLELLGYILSLVSTKEVLAVARCSRYLCHTLVNNPSSLYIWKAARELCRPMPFPLPTPNFTESSYAAFIFDGGPCELCGKFTPAFYKSFALRLRVCNKACFSSWFIKMAIAPMSFPDSRAVMRWLPRLENQSDPYYRRSDFLKEVRDFKRIACASPGGADAYTLLHSFDEKKRIKIETLSELLQGWVNIRLQFEESIRAQILRFCRNLAEKEGWNFHLLRNAPTFDALASSCQRALRVPRPKEFRRIRKTVTEEITLAQLRLDRRTEELQYARRREIVQKLYLELKTENGGKEAFPTLGLFRSLPVVSSLQNKEGKTNLELLKKISIPSVKMMISNDLSTWRDLTSRKFSSLLGFKDYRTISTKTLHPLDRLTSRFNCLNCRRYYTKTRGSVSEIVLDYKEACSHVCQFTPPHRRNDALWRVEQFVLDRKAADTTQIILDQLGVCDDEIVSLEKVNALGAHICCLSCKGYIIMDLPTLQRHCHRHSEVCHLVIDEAAAANQPKFMDGLCLKLLGFEKSARRKQSLTIYGCRHCLVRGENNLPSQTQATAICTDSNVDTRKIKIRKSPWMNFNGLRSHLKAKHNILNISDEDMYCEAK